MKNVKAAIIDDGIYSDRVHSYMVNEDNSVIPYTDTRNIANHGTECFEIFDAVAHAQNCISIKAGESDSYGRLSSEKLIAALEWCFENEVELISISLGTSFVNEFIRYEHILKKLLAKETIIVAAINNRNQLTCPASIPGILGVRYDKAGKLPDGQFELLENELLGTNLVVNPNHDGFCCDAQNSFAVPYIAGLLYRALASEKLARGNVKSWLRNHAYVITNVSMENDFYENLISKHNIEDPVNIGILLEDKQRLSLGKVFNKAQYTAIELVIKEDIWIELLKQRTPLEKWKKIYDILIRIAEPDILIWYIEKQENIYHMTNFFDAFILKNGCGEENEKLKKMLNQDGIFLSCEDGMDEQALFRQICSVFQ